MNWLICPADAVRVNGTLFSQKVASCERVAVIVTTLNVSRTMMQAKRDANYMRRQTMKTNYEAIRDSLNREELVTLMLDIIHYDDPLYAWQSVLCPPLPFEDWTEWLERTADFNRRF